MFRANRVPECHRGHGGAGAGWQAVWQGANNHVWTTDTGLTMMPGTSPDLTALS